MHHLCCTNLYHSLCPVVLLDQAIDAMQRLLKKDLLPFEGVIAQTSVVAHQSEPSNKDEHWFVQ